MFFFLFWIVPNIHLNNTLDINIPGNFLNVYQQIINLLSTLSIFRWKHDKFFDESTYILDKTKTPNLELTSHQSTIIVKKMLKTQISEETWFRQDGEKVDLASTGPGDRFRWPADLEKPSISDFDVIGAKKNCWLVLDRVTTWGDL